MPEGPNAGKPAEQFPAEVLSHLSEVISREIGIHLPQERWKDLKRAIHAVCKDKNTQCADDLVTAMLALEPDVQLLRALSLHLTIGETYFFRDEALFSALREHILPPLLSRAQRGEGPVRIWSAGCSTGEEPYSVAMLLTELGARVQDSFIIATDLNANSLQAAHDAVYGEWSFRGGPPDIKSRYFRNIGKKYVLAAPIRQRVTFQQLNLVKDELPCVNGELFDIILCRNVLMYFERQTAQHQVKNFYGCLKDTGWLALAASEIAHLEFTNFRPVRFTGVLLHQKQPGYKPSPGITGNTMPPVPRGQIRQPKSKLPPPRLKSREAAETLAAPLASRRASDTIMQGKEQTPTSPEVRRFQFLSDSADYHQLLRDALLLLDKDMAGDDKSDCFLLAARAAANIGKLDAAVEWCKLAQKAAPHNITACHLAGVLLQAAGLPDEAAAELRRALYLNPDHIGCQIAYARLLRQQGNSGASRKLLEAAFSALDKLPAERLVPDMDGMTAGDVATVVLQLLRSKGVKQ